MAKKSRARGSMLSLILHQLAVAVGSSLFTLAFFLVLPVIQAISGERGPSLEVRKVSGAVIEPPDAPPIEEPEPEEQEPEEPPPPPVDAQPLDLAQLELALNPGLGAGGLAGDFTVDLSAVTGGSGGMDALFGAGDLDQEPRVIYRAGPQLDARIRARAPGAATIIFIVDERGRVSQARVETSTDQIFERPALDAMKKWRFEPARRKGEPVSFRMRQKITFPKM